MSVRRSPFAVETWLLCLNVAIVNTVSDSSGGAVVSKVAKRAETVPIRGPSRRFAERPLPRANC